MDGIYHFGISLIQWLQTMSPGLDGFMKAITFLGTMEFYIIFIPAIYWSINQATGLRVLFILVTTDIFASGLKHLLHEPRPYWFGKVEALSTETSYGIPSSHASNTLAVWGQVIRAVQSTWGVVVIVVLLLLIGISRLYLGVHFPQDVLVGWVIGLLSLFFFIKYEGRFMDWWGKNTLNIQILFGFIFSIVIALLGMLILLIISGSTDPSTWSSFSGQARDYSHYMTLSGFAFGAVAGVALMQKYARFSSDGSTGQRVLRYAVGMVVLFAIYLGLDVLFGLFAEDATTLGYILRYIRYGSVAFWASFGAPWVFIKFKLAKKL